jgi:hypothetical protein
MLLIGPCFLIRGPRADEEYQFIRQREFENINLVAAWHLSVVDRVSLREQDIPHVPVGLEQRRHVRKFFTVKAFKQAHRACCAEAGVGAQ